MDIAKLMANEHPENLPLSNGLNIPASRVEKPPYLVLEVALEQSVIITMIGTCCDPSAFFGILVLEESVDFRSSIFTWTIVFRPCYDSNSGSSP